MGGRYLRLREVHLVLGDGQLRQPSQNLGLWDDLVEGGFSSVQERPETGQTV